MKFGIRRTARAAVQTAHGLVLGFGGIRIPIGSRIVGRHSMRLGRGFYANGPVWLEVVGHDEAGRVRLSIGEGFQTAQGLHIAASHRVEIGRNCLFGSGVLVTDHGHGTYDAQQIAGESSPDQPPAYRPLSRNGSVTVGDRVWLGDGVKVLRNVRIGNGAIIGANSVVAQDVPAESIAVGSPAVVIKQYDRASGTWQRAR